jgi:hypothetical protein
MLRKERLRVTRFTKFHRHVAIVIAFVAPSTAVAAVVAPRVDVTDVVFLLVPLPRQVLSFRCLVVVVVVIYKQIMQDDAALYVSEDQFDRPRIVRDCHWNRPKEGEASFEHPNGMFRRNPWLRHQSVERFFPPAQCMVTGRLVRRHQGGTAAEGGISQEEVPCRVPATSEEIGGSPGKGHGSIDPVVMRAARDTGQIFPDFPFVAVHDHRC